MSKFSRQDVGGSASDDAASCPVVPIADHQRIELLDSLESLDIGWFWATDTEGRLTYLTASAAASLGVERSAIIGRKLTEVVVADRSEDDEGRERPLAFQLGARNAFVDVPVKPVDGSTGVPTWWEISGKPCFDAENEFVGYRGRARDVSHSRQHSIDASRLAKFDTLTGLANRHRMESQLRKTLKAYQASKRSCALLMLDLDRFKQVNDTLGHPAGDELLKQVAQRLVKIVGKHAEIGRLGGDEFQIILPDVDDRGRLGDLGKRLIQMISQPYSIDGSRAIIGTSVGIAIAPYDGIDAEELVSSADLALYAAKGNGRGQYRFFSSDLKDGARQRKQIEEDLRDALAKDELRLHYQPLIKAGSDEAACFEALMRWEHAEDGFISPGQFIPIAEETSIITDLGEWALMRACRDCAEWPGDIKVAVNVSAVQFSDENFLGVVERALASSGLDPQRLELEITESVFMGDPHATSRMFKQLKRLGVRLALDDFGTGYSSLGYLRNAPFDKIKIDQSFVRGATEPDNNNAAIITAIVSLADALGMDTVAEGVESEDELALVTERGATLIQGFIYSGALAQDVLLGRFEDGTIQFEKKGPAKHRSERRTVFRRVGLIHEDHRYEVMLRNLSRTGAMIEGLLDVPIGTDLVLDLGAGQLAVAKVRRSHEAVQGIEFEVPLISDGADGLCTRHRVSPYALAAAGMPLAALPPGNYPLLRDAPVSEGGSRPSFLQVDLTQRFN
ncbi:EAL domain-containing protein [Qipengyuania sp. JC766]|uniref:putative bifunctional diguanylate cyclase/phosphodiesterase n=1 Tax=Qipengyuania sp. JC766 TaxID=3232139 RepID=UPI003459EEF6